MLLKYFVENRHNMNSGIQNDLTPQVLLSIFIYERESTNMMINATFSPVVQLCCASLMSSFF